MTRRISMTALTLFYVIQSVVYLSDACFSSGVCNCMQNPGCGTCGQPTFSSAALSDCGGGCGGQPSPYGAPLPPPPPPPPPPLQQQSYVLTSGAAYRPNYFPAGQLPPAPLRFEYPQNPQSPPPPPSMPYGPPIYAVAPAPERSSQVEIVEQKSIVHPTLMEVIRPTSTVSQSAGETNHLQYAVHDGTESTQNRIETTENHPNEDQKPKNQYQYNYQSIKHSNENHNENENENEIATTTDYRNHVVAGTEKTLSGYSNHVGSSANEVKPGNYGNYFQHADDYQLDNSAELVGASEQREMRITVIDKRPSVTDSDRTKNGHDGSTTVGAATKRTISSSRINAANSTVATNLISGRDSNENVEKSRNSHSHSLPYVTGPPASGRGGERLSEYSRSENSYYSQLESLASTLPSTVATEATTVTPTTSTTTTTTTMTYNEEHLTTVNTPHSSNTVYEYAHGTSTTVIPPTASGGHSLADRWDSLPVVPPSASDASDGGASVDGVEYLAVIRDELQERRVDPYAIYYDQICDGVAFGRSIENGTVAAAEKCSRVGCAALNVRAVGLDFEVVYLRVVNARRPSSGFNCMSVLNVPSVLSYGGDGLNTFVGAQKRVSKFVGET